MKTFGLAACLFTLCFSSLLFAEDAAAPAMGPSAKIAVAPAVATKPAMIVAAAFVKAADFAPEGGWKETDFEGAINSMVMAGSTRAMDYLKEKGLESTGPMFAVWYQDPTTTKPGDWTSKWCVPIAADNEPTALVSVEHMPEMQAITCTYEGHPQTAMNAWQEIQKFAETNGYTWTGAPMEVYHAVGEQKPDATGWKVEIVWPAMKNEAPAEEEKH